MGFSSFKSYGSSIATSKIIPPYFAPRNYNVSGLSTDGYQVYTFTTTTKNYHSISYNLEESKTLYILAVGGGGCGGFDNAGGGGAGGVVLTEVKLPVGSDTINITVGAGQPSNRTYRGTGETTYVSFANNPTLNIIAGGGGGGSVYGYVGNNGSINGGSGSGGALGTAQSSGIANRSNNNLAFNGGTGTQFSAGGGGGAGVSGQDGAESNNGITPKGGDGVLCGLLGIKTFGNYGTYYWGGAGGGCGYNTDAGNGGLGGGGGGSSTSTYAFGVGDKNSLSSGQNGGIRTTGGSGGNNTGGGGGASTINGFGGAGGSGIVIVAFL